MNQHLDQGRHSDACRAVSRRLLWTRRGKPSFWLLLLAGLCAFVCIKSAEMRPRFSCVAKPGLPATVLPEGTASSQPAPEGAMPLEWPVRRQRLRQTLTSPRRTA
jgi:hypothetical protein